MCEEFDLTKELYLKKIVFVLKNIVKNFKKILKDT